MKNFKNIEEAKKLYKNILKNGLKEEDKIFIENFIENGFYEDEGKFFMLNNLYEEDEWGCRRLLCDIINGKKIFNNKYEKIIEDIDISSLKETLESFDEDIIITSVNIKEFVTYEYKCGDDDDRYDTEECYFYSVDEFLNYVGNFDDKNSSSRLSIAAHDSIISGEIMLDVNIVVEKTVQVDEVCDTCSQFYDEQGNYKEGGVDKLFDCKIWSHGLATGFSGRLTSEEIKKRATEVTQNPEWQICCSDKSQRIGGIGLYVQGHVLYASNVDLWSSVDYKGHRTFNMSDWRADGLITSLDEYSLDRWDHNEVILTNYKIVGIWIKDWFFNQEGIKDLWEEIKKTAKENNLAVHIVKKRLSEE